MNEVLSLLMIIVIFIYSIHDLGFNIVHDLTHLCTCILLIPVFSNKYIGK